MTFAYPGGVALPVGNYWIGLQTTPTGTGFEVALSRSYPLSYGVTTGGAFFPAILPGNGFSGSIVGGPAYQVNWSCP